MNDKIAVALTDNAAMRIYAAVTTELAAEAQKTADETKTTKKSNKSV